MQFYARSLLIALCGGHILGLSAKMGQMLFQSQTSQHKSDLHFIICNDRDGHLPTSAFCVVFTTLNNAFKLSSYEGDHDFRTSFCCPPRGEFPWIRLEYQGWDILLRLQWILCYQDILIFTILVDLTYFAHILCSSLDTKESNSDCCSSLTLGYTILRCMSLDLQQPLLRGREVISLP